MSKPVTRRAVLCGVSGSALTLSLLTACGTAVVTTPASAPALPDPVGVSVSTSLKEIANGTLGMLPKFGLSAGTVAKVRDITNKLFDVSDQLAATSSNTNWRALVNDGLSLVSILAPLLPGGQFVAAIASVVPEIIEVAGLVTTHPLGRAVMPPGQAHAMLRRAAIGEL